MFLNFSFYVPENLKLTNVDEPKIITDLLQIRNQFFA